MRSHSSSVIFFGRFPFFFSGGIIGGLEDEEEEEEEEGAVTSCVTSALHALSL